MTPEELAMRMIEQEISRISESLYPCDALATGVIVANYRHGFIDESQLVKYERLASKTAADRRLELRAESSARRMNSLKQLHGEKDGN